MAVGAVGPRRATVRGDHAMIIDALDTAPAAVLPASPLRRTLLPLALLRRRSIRRVAAAAALGGGGLTVLTGASIGLVVG